MKAILFLLNIDLLIKVVSIVLVGISNAEQFTANLAETELELSAEDIAILDEITAPKLRYPNTFVGLQDGILKAAKV